MEHELVVAFDLIVLDPNHQSVIGNADQEVATFGIEERGNGLQHCMGHALVVFAIFLEAPPQRRFELQRLSIRRA
jgi:hypothetical protein